MKHILLIAGAASFAFAGPALAQGHGNHHGKDHGAGSVGYGTGGCPPGLAKKNPPCVPPGQAKKLYEVGHHFSQDYRGWTPYNQIPYDLRHQYQLDPNGRYVFDQNYIYQVDPKTLVVSQILNAVLR